MNRLLKYVLIISFTIVPNWSFAEETMDMKERDKIKAEMLEMLILKDFKHIDKRLTRYEKKLEKTKSGLPKINIVFFPLAEAIYKKANRDALIQAWKEQVPKSYYPYLADASGLNDTAWEARGTGYSNTISERSSHNARTYTDEGIKMLEAIKFPNGIRSPLYYNLRMNAVTLSSSQNKKAELFGLLNEATYYHPTYFSPYYKVLHQLQTKWHGEPGEMVSFIKKQANALKGKDGDMLYALLARQILELDMGSRMQRQRFLGVDYFYKNPGIDWPRMRKGFKSLVESYPSDWNINDFAWFACVAGDKKTAKKLLKRSQLKPLKDIWGGEKGYVAWTEWLKQTDYPLPESSKKNWKSINENNVPVRLGEKNNEGIAPVELTNNGVHFEGVAKFYPNGSAIINGPGYEKSEQKEVRGNFLASFSQQEKGMIGTYWKKRIYDSDKESSFVGNSITVGNIEHKAGSEIHNNGFSYLGSYQNSKQTGLGRVIDLRSGFKGMPEVYYGELSDGIFEGFGLLAGSKLFNGYTFVGTFKKGKPVGIGAVINLSIGFLPKLDKHNIKFIRCIDDGSFEPVEIDPNGKFDFIHYKYENELAAYLGFIENGSPKGMGIQLVSSYNNFILMKWTHGDAVSSDFFKVTVPDFEWYYNNSIKVKTLVRNNIVFQGNWNGLTLYKGDVVFPDGRIIHYN